MSLSLAHPHSSLLYPHRTRVGGGVLTTGLRCKIQSRKLQLGSHCTKRYLEGRNPLGVRVAKPKVGGESLSRPVDRANEATECSPRPKRSVIFSLLVIESSLFFFGPSYLKFTTKLTFLEALSRPEHSTPRHITTLSRTPTRPPREVSRNKTPTTAPGRPGTDSPTTRSDGKLRDDVGSGTPDPAAQAKD